MKKNILKWLKRFSIFLLTVVVLGTGYGYYFLHKSLPQVEGKMEVTFLNNNVNVYRDDKGVPTIEANSDEDLYKAQGFIQAQDRLFQMDLARRQASGRLSEVVGKAALDNDKKFLVFSLRKAAEKSYDGYSDEAKKILNYFAEGVNSYIKQAKEKGTLPYEFSLLGYEPEEWTAIDSLTIGKYMAYDLGGHWNHLAFNNWVLNNLGENTLKQMLPETFSTNKDNEEIIAINKNLAANIDSKTASIEVPPKENGSNNWVLAGSKTKTGKPLIADDPHLSLSTPSVWYQMSLKSPNVKVSGVIFAGIPGIILGHNEEIAWSVTNFGPDVQDLYIEKAKENDNHKFEYDGDYYDAEVTNYDIKVKGQNPEKFEVVTTKHGPIINELIKPLNNKDQFSMQWTALESTQELEAILQFNKAKNWQQFETALEKFKAPAQNFVFADNSGNIAYKSNGLVPIRKKGDGNLPVPGYSSEYGWSGYVDFDKLPRLVNPEDGFIATANTETLKNFGGYHTSNVWAQPYRKERIDEVLKSKNDFTAEDMQKLQMDTKNLYAGQFIPEFLKRIDSSKVSAKALEQIKSWNFVDDKEKSAPLIFDVWMTKIQEKLFKNKIGDEVFKFMPHKEHYVDKLLIDSINGKNIDLINEAGGLNNVITDSFNDTISELEGKFGKDITKWQWGENHKLSFRHSLSAASKLLGTVLNPKEYPISGSKVTVQAAAVRKNNEGLVNHGASWRFVYDFNDNTGYHIVGPGQSGHFMSPHYDDQVKDWIEGKYNSEQLNNTKKNKTLELVAKK